MADTKISALTAVTVPAGSDEIAVNQGGNSKKLPASLVIATDVTDAGNAKVADTRYLPVYDRLVGSSTNRLTLEGTGRVAIDRFENPIENIRGFSKRGDVSFVVPDGFAFFCISRVDLRGLNRATLRGDADLVIDDNMASRSRIVLSGVG